MLRLATLLVALATATATNTALDKLTAGAAAAASLKASVIGYNKSSAGGLLAALAAEKNATLGGAMLVGGAGGGPTAPTGDLLCYVAADGTVAGLASANFNYACAKTGVATVVVPVGAGYIASVSASPAKDGVHVGELVFTIVPPYAGGKPTTVACGAAGVGPALPLGGKAGIGGRVANLRATCAAVSAGRRRSLQQVSLFGRPARALAYAGLGVDVAPLPTGGVRVGTTMNGAPVGGTPLTIADAATVDAVNGVPAWKIFATQTTAGAPQLASVDSGVTWQNRTITSAAGWWAVASDAAGATLYATADLVSTPVYVSRDWGVTWAPTASPPGIYLSIATSADGRVVIACGTNTVIRSTDGGATWSSVTVQGATTFRYNRVAISLDGTIAAIVSDTNQGELSLSYDGGATFVTSGALPDLNFFNVAMSGDGTLMAATVTGGGIYVSSDKGVTWRQANAPNRSWRTLAISADGSRLVAAHVQGAATYVSEDGGLNWRETSASCGAFESAVITQDGAKIAIACYIGTSSAIVMSVDGGRTWQTTPTAVGSFFNAAASLG